MVENGEKEKSCPDGQLLKIIYVWRRADVVY